MFCIAVGSRQWAPWLGLKSAWVKKHDDEENVQHRKSPWLNMPAGVMYHTDSASVWDGRGSG